jgi:PKD repeat protein
MAHYYTRAENTLKRAVYSLTRKVLEKNVTFEKKPPFMKKLYLTLIVILFHFKALSQALYGSKVDSLNINNVHCAIYNNSLLWNDYARYRSSYFIQDTLPHHVIYTGSFNLLAKHNNELYYSGVPNIYKNEGFYPGPIGFNDYLTAANSLQYNRIWRLYKYQVEAHKINFANPNYVTPVDILEYPWQYFPYRDVNNNGFYDPQNGDYPEYNLDGTLTCNDYCLVGDLTLLWIMNDKGMASNNSPGLGVNIYGEAYAFIGNESLNNASFLRYRIENQSLNNYDSAFIQFFVDHDIGCSNDDFIGSDVKRGLVYGYNGDGFDEASSGCILPLGSSSPAVGFDIVKGPSAPLNDGKDNNHNGIIDEPGEDMCIQKFLYFIRPDLALPQFQTPASAVQFYNAALGKHINGVHQTYGNTSIPANYAFPDSTDFGTWYSTNGIDPGFSWSMIGGNYQPADYNGIFSAGPFILAPHQIQSFTLAIPYAKAYGGTNIESVKKLKLADDTIQEFVNNCYVMTDCAPFSELLFINENQTGSFSYAHPQVGTSYHWNFGDGNTSTLRFPFHTYTQGGTYTVCLTITSACDQKTICKDIFVSFDVENLTAVDIIRIEGEGNGGRELELTYASELTMFSEGLNYIPHPKYVGKKAPIKVEIIDHSSLDYGNYQIAFDGVSPTNNWKIYKIGSNDTIYSIMPLGANSRQIIPEWGIAVTVEHYTPTVLYQSGLNTFHKPDLISYSKRINNPSLDWLGGVKDQDFSNYENWIASGIFDVECSAVPIPNNDLCIFNDKLRLDPSEIFETATDGTLAPFSLIRSGYNHIFESNHTSTINTKPFNRIPSIDIVYTPDTNHWTRCPVIEMCDEPVNAQNYGQKLRLRQSPSLGKDGLPDGSGNGMGWFPGYAIDIETGGRLNMAFGESSCLPNQNGADMKFNPTSEMYGLDSIVYFGGKHVVFVFNCDRKDGFLIQTGDFMPYYDEGQYAYSKLSSSNFYTQNQVWSSTAWVGMPMLNSGSTLLSTIIRQQVRLKKPFRTYAYQFADTLNNRNPLYQFTIDSSFELAPQSELSHLTYPNPSNGIYNFEIFQSEDQAYFGLIYDLNGSVIKEIRTTSNKFSVDISNLPAGYYLYFLYNTDASVLAKGKLLVVH